MKEFQKVLVVIETLFIIAAGLTETVYAQSCLNNDSLIHYTEDMDKKCLTCLVNNSKKDSLVSNLSLQLVNFKKITQNMNVIEQDNSETISKLEDENQKINLHLKKAQLNTKIFGFGGVAVGIVGVLLLK